MPRVVIQLCLSLGHTQREMKKSPLCTGTQINTQVPMHMLCKLSLSLSPSLCVSLSPTPTNPNLPPPSLLPLEMSFLAAVGISSGCSCQASVKSP